MAQSAQLDRDKLALDQRRKASTAKMEENGKLLAKLLTDAKLTREELVEAKKMVALASANEAQAKEEFRISQATIIHLQSAFAEPIKEVKGASMQPQAPGGTCTLSVDEANNITDLQAEAAFRLNLVSRELKPVMAENERLRSELKASQQELHAIAFAAFLRENAEL